jgi:type II secretory pathway pseudopilin PulG
MERRTPPTDRLRRTRHADAFTLIESLMASCVLALAVMSIAAALSSSHQHDRHVAEQIVAVRVAQDALETAAAATLAPAEDEPGIDDLDGLSEQFDADGGRVQSLVPLQGAYVRQVRVTRPGEVVGGATRGEVALVTVTVQTPSGRSVSLSRLVSRVAQAD